MLPGDQGQVGGKPLYVQDIGEWGQGVPQSPNVAWPYLHKIRSVRYMKRPAGRVDIEVKEECEASLARL